MSHFGISSAAVLLMVSVLSSCATPEAPAEEALIRRDSAGIAIVEALKPTWEVSQRWRVDSEPVVDVSRSGIGEAHEFFRVRDMRRMPNGAIAVANRGTNEIRLFTMDGRFLRAVGGAGDGPGEYRNLRMLETTGDTLVVLDSDGRVTVLGPELDLIRTWELRYRAVSIHDIADGEMAVQFISPSMTSVREGGALIRNPGVLYRIGPTGVMIDSIASTAGGEEYIHASPDGGRTASRPLFGKSSHVATWNGHIYRGSADDMQVEELTAVGELLRILRIPDFPLALTNTQIRAERVSYLGADLPPGVTELPPFLRRLVEELPNPARRPAYSDIHVDPLGAIWLRPFVGRSEMGTSEEWQVIADNGTWLGGVEIPGNFTVFDIDEDVVLGVFVDDLGVERPQVLRLHRN